MNKEILKLFLMGMLFLGCASEKQRTCTLSAQGSYLSLPSNVTQLIVSPTRVTYQPIALPEHLQSYRFQIDETEDGQIAFTAPSAESDVAGYRAPQKIEYLASVIQQVDGCNILDPSDLLPMVNSSAWYDDETDSLPNQRNGRDQPYTFIRSRKDHDTVSFLYSLPSSHSDSAMNPKALIIRFQEVNLDPVHVNKPNLSDAPYFYQTSIKNSASHSDTINIFWPTHKHLELTVSPSFPATYLPALTSAIGYWNEALGTETITWKRSQEPIDILDPKINSVQWLHWPHGSYSYADARYDPSSGHIIQTAMYLSSSMFTYPINRTIGDIYQSDSKPRHQLLCKRQPLKNHYMRKKVERDDYQQELALDAATSLIAHELGHMIGLRHNFAASLQTELKATDLSKIRSDIIERTHEHTNVEPASSVMDYAYYEVDLLIGRHIREGKGPLLFDQNMGRLLRGERMTDILLFCSDQDEHWADCTEFDSFADPLLSNLLEFKYRLEAKAIAMAARYRLFLSGDTGDLSAAESVDELVEYLLSYVRLQLVRMNSDRFLSIETKYEDPAGLDYAKVIMEVRDRQQESLKIFSGAYQNIFELFANPPVRDNRGNELWTQFWIDQVNGKLSPEFRGHTVRYRAVQQHLADYSKSFAEKWRKKLSILEKDSLKEDF